MGCQGVNGAARRRENQQVVAITTVVTSQSTGAPTHYDPVRRSVSSAVISATPQFYSL